MFPISVIDNLEFCFEVSLLAVGVGTVNMTVIPCTNSKLLNLEAPLVAPFFGNAETRAPCIDSGIRRYNKNRRAGI